MVLFATLLISCRPGERVTEETEETSAPPETLPTEVDAVVTKLLHLDGRDDAFRKVMGRQIYRGEGTYTEDTFQNAPAGIVRHVVACPQPKGPPMFAVFAGPRGPRHQAVGHIILIDSDGVIVRVYSAANSLDETDHFKDINGDGVVDMVHSWHKLDSQNRTGSVVHITPVTREQQPVLLVAYNREPVKEEWGWRLTEEKGGRYALELGPKKAGTEDITPKATYRWSDKEKRYEGPDGGPGEPFMRLKDDGLKSLEQFLSGKE
jgi:hypothetical protein